MLDMPFPAVLCLSVNEAVIEAVNEAVKRRSSTASRTGMRSGTETCYPLIAAHVPTATTATCYVLQRRAPETVQIGLHLWWGSATP
jgi:hypothetical protein